MLISFKQIKASYSVRYVYANNFYSKFPLLQYSKIWYKNSPNKIYLLLLSKIIYEKDVFY